MTGVQQERSVPASRRRLPRAPAGVAVVAASALAGLAVFAYFAIADRVLSDAASDRFAVFYSLSLLIGFGAFQPLESELARTLGHRADPAVGLREAGGAAAVVAGVALAIVALAAAPLLGLLGGSGWLLAATSAVVVVSAVQFWVRGALLGAGRPAAFAATIAVDSLLRVAVAGVLALAVTPLGAPAFTLSLLVPLLVAHLAFLPAVRRGVRTRSPAGSEPEARAGRRGHPLALLRRIAPLFVATACAQVLLNAPALLVAALAPPGGAAAFLFAFTLARIPLFMAVPVQGALVPPMAAMALAGRLDRLVRRLVAVTGVVAGIAVVGGALAAWLGPDLLGVLFPRRGAVPGGDLALMVVGVAAHVGLLVSAQANLAIGSHRGSGASWALALAVAALVFAAVPAAGATGPLLRVELAFAAGSAAGWALAMVLLLRSARGDRAR